VASDVVSTRQLPVRLYQIGKKFRDEARPRAGLLRGKEFVMKDLYTFDVNEEDALATYDAVNEAYRRMFERIGLPFAVVGVQVLAPCYLFLRLFPRPKPTPATLEERVRMNTILFRRVSNRLLRPFLVHAHRLNQPERTNC